MFMKKPERPKQKMALINSKSSGAIENSLLISQRWITKPNTKRIGMETKIIESNGSSLSSV
jgi:hypothetical protein